jgi:hypothetical protein
MTFLHKSLFASVVLFGASTVACSGTVAGIPGDEPAPAEPPAEPPSTPDAPPAKLRVAHLWENRDAVDLCVLPEGATGAGVRPTYRAQGAVSDRVIGGIPQYKVGKYIRLEPGPRQLKLVAADAADCSADSIATQTLRLESAAAVTMVLWGDDTQRVRIENFSDLRTPAQKAESVRFYDFAIDSSDERRAWFDEIRLHDFRSKPEDVVLAPNQVGRFAHEVAGKTASTNHETRELGLVTVFAAGVIADDTFRIVVCEDDERAVGPLTDCR